MLAKFDAMKTILLIVVLAIGCWSATAQDNPPAKTQAADTNAPGVSAAPTSEPDPAQPTPQSKVSPAAAKRKPVAPVLGYLESRDRVIVVHPRHRYSVRTKDGKVLADAITVEKMQASFPDLYNLVKTSVASEIAYPDARIWREFGPATPRTQLPPPPRWLPCPERPEGPGIPPLPPCPQPQSIPIGTLRLTPPSR